MSVFSAEFTSLEANRNIVVRVLFPDSPFDLEQCDTAPKTMYLLHGGGGSSGDWLRFTSLEFYARKYNFHIVMADAGGSSFYSDMAYGGHYLKFFGEELPAFVNARFRLPQDTFICGQSMGGYGCLKVGLNYPEHYKAIGCLSGGVSIDSIVARFSSEQNQKTMKAIFGDPVTIKDSDRIEYLARRAVSSGKAPKIFGVCGTEDFLYEDNVKFYSYLKEIGYDSEAVFDRGTHMWDFWDRQMPKLMERLCAYNREQR